MRLAPLSRYVALGSSFAAGPGLNPLVAPASGRSAVNYPHQLAQRGGFELVDRSAAGATTEHVLDTAQVLFDGTQAAPQILAVTADTDLVTLTVGGNDVQYLLSLLRCSAHVAPEPVPAWMVEHLALSVETDLVAKELAQLPERIGALLAAIRARAPRARVLVVDYLTVIGDCAAACPALPMSDADRLWCAGLGRALETATAEAASSSGVELVSASVASREHSVCSREPWVGGWGFGDVLSGGTMAYHPTAAGMAAVTDLLVSHLSNG